MKAKLKHFGKLQPAEKKLRDAVQRGTWARVSTKVPQEKSPEVTIRASFIRYLALGGCDACRTAAPGVQVFGAWIESDGDPNLPTRGLFLDGAKLCGDLYLFHCHIQDTIHAYGAKVTTLGFDYSRLAAGLEADRLQAEGNVFLRRSDIAGTVRLVDASVGGSLECDGATLRVEDGETAFVADRLHAAGGVFLRQSEINGTVRLSGSRLGGGLSCAGVKLRTADGEYALLAQNLRADGTFFLREGAAIDGMLDLRGAEVGGIVDDRDCWPEPGNLLLDRFRYGAILGGPVDAETRLKWLALQNPSAVGEDFWPQPYEQLAKVFREMGHAEDARRVLVEKERLLRADRRARARRNARHAQIRWDWLWDPVLSITAGYGHRPMRALGWLFGFWILGAMVFSSAMDREALKPNNSFVLRAPEWAACDPGYVRPTNGPPARWSGAYGSQLACFLDQPEAAGYPIFNPFIYSADTLLPIVDLEMQANWIPDERRARAARWFLWVQIIMGWALSLLAVAGFSGLVKSD